ncbi:hypothetical protein [Planococcus chinensis]|uniref:hypothetical protein n=1 Tax=Planococcus chinensis TaxID=272917 RepID=UPI001CC33D05|nr:hypothetical protein [Planococcus chinensis]
MLANIQSQLGAQAVERISDQALRDASLVFKSSLISQLETFKDTGATVDEVTFTEPYSVNGVRTITVHWKGPKGRYRVIHLNEYGTVKNPNPRGKGAIARALQASEAAYKRAIAESIGRSI